MSFPKITFGIIVLNGEPFVRYLLRSLYPFAHEIIVVEGASRFAKAIATPDGHSTDTTLQTLQEFQKNEDPDQKLRIIIRDGFWDEKDQQSRAYAEAATGDYLWQVDVDEFYHDNDIRNILERIHQDPSISGASVRYLTFWGGFDYIVDGWYPRTGLKTINRIFRWGKGYSYHQHRPVIILDDQGRDLRSLNWIDGDRLADQGIYMHHYSLVFPKQVYEKSKYYDAAEWIERDQYAKWAKDVFSDLKKPYRVHNVYTSPSWLERFQGKHPEQIEFLRKDIQEHRIMPDLRNTEDIERLLNSFYYPIGRAALKMIGPVKERCAPVWQMFQFAIKNPRRVGSKIRSLLR